MKGQRGLVIAVTLAGWLGHAGTAAAQSDAIVSDRQANLQVLVRDVVVRDGIVSGLIMNRSSKPLRDVRLLIRYQWVWNDERNPGSDNPGRVAYHTVHDEIPSDVSVSFTYRPSPPLPQRSDGHFETMVEVVGFTEVGE
jgi:hypothetical protein